jgi:hypothetical protein
VKFAKDPSGGNIIPAQKGKWYVGTTNMSEVNYELVKVLDEPHETQRFGKVGGKYRSGVDCVEYQVNKGSVVVIPSELIANNFVSPAYYREARRIDFRIFISMVFGEQGEWSNE